MSGFTEQQISAGAATVGQFATILACESEQRRKNQEVMGEMVQIEGAASLAAGQAQQASYHEEAAQSTARAIETGLQAGGNLGSEGTGELGERAYNRTESAKNVETRVTNCDKWEKLLSNKSGGHVEAALDVGGAAQAAPGRNLTPSEVTEIEGAMKGADGKILNPDHLPEALKAKIELAKRSNDPQLVRLRKEARWELKQAQKASESKSSFVQRKRDQVKTIVTSTSQAAQAKCQTDIAAAQEEAGVQRLLQSQQDFAKDSMGKADRTLSDANSSLGQGISSSIAASNKMWESNSRA